MNVNTEHGILLAGSGLAKSFRDIQTKTCFTFDCLKHHQS